MILKDLKINQKICTNSGEIFQILNHKEVKINRKKHIITEFVMLSTGLIIKQKELYGAYLMLKKEIEINGKKEVIEYPGYWGTIQLDNYIKQVKNSKGFAM
jgi:hypothetical protein